MLNFSGTIEKQPKYKRKHGQNELQILKSLSPEELNTLRVTIKSILFPEPIPVSINHEASDVRKGKIAQEFPHCVHCGSDAIHGHGT